jgi:hypothetical protein
VILVRPASGYSSLGLRVFNAVGTLVGTVTGLRFTGNVTVVDNGDGTATVNVQGGGGGAGGFSNVERFTVANGQTAFVVATPIAGGERSTLVFLNGIARDPATDYAVVGATLTFLFVPATGAKVMVYYTAA